MKSQLSHEESDRNANEEEARQSRSNQAKPVQLSEALHVGRRPFTSGEAGSHGAKRLHSEAARGLIVILKAS